jgi:DNA-directed RNA polymerase specialized sigma24 family protein
MHAPSHPKELSPCDQTLLFLLAQAGDRAALEQLLRDSHRPLRRYITRLAGADLADDILQETSIQIFRKLPFLHEPAVFPAWVLRIASRIAIRQLKRTHRWQPLDDSSLGAFTPNPDLGGPPTGADCCPSARLRARSRSNGTNPEESKLALPLCARTL